MTTPDDDRTHGGIYPDVDRVDEVIRQMPNVGFGSHYVDAVRAARDALAALSSPPADDVREALARAIRRGYLGTDGYSPTSDDYNMADEVMAAFEVRLRGTVTDARIQPRTQSEREAWDDGFASGLGVHS
jgi:hypothetical protein